MLKEVLLSSDSSSAMPDWATANDSEATRTPRTSTTATVAGKLVLEPIFEADFVPVYYGFRPRRRAHDAIADIHPFGTQGYRWVLDADIEACFDSIDHTALMDRVRRRVKDKRVFALVEAFLKAGVLTEAGNRQETPTNAAGWHPVPAVGQHCSVGAG